MNFKVMSLYKQNIIKIILDNHFAFGRLHFTPLHEILLAFCIYIFLFHVFLNKVKDLTSLDQVFFKHQGLSVWNDYNHNSSDKLVSLGLRCCSHV